MTRFAEGGTNGNTSARQSPTSPGGDSSGTLYQGYANYAAQVVLANTIGTTPAIPNALASAAANTAVLVDPVQIQAYKETVASQLNAQSGGPRFEDLAERIADIKIMTVAQGAGTLTVTLIDPYLVTMTMVKNGGTFIQVDENGYLYPPIDIQFPSGTDCVWRLCQVSSSMDFTQPNLTLTFEDRIVSMLREVSPGNGGLAQGTANQTLGGFIKMLVDNTNQTLAAKPPIRLVELIAPQDPNYALPVTSLPSSATTTGAIRNNPNKTAEGLRNEIANDIKAWERFVASLAATSQANAATINGLETLYAAHAAQQLRNEGIGTGVPNWASTPGGG